MKGKINVADGLVEEKSILDRLLEIIPENRTVEDEYYAQKIDEAKKTWNELDLKDDPKNEKRTILLECIEKEIDKLLGFIAEHYPEVISYTNKNGLNVLMLAAKNGRTEIVRIILSSETIDINARNQYGCTALMLAATNGREEIAELIIQNNADINAVQTGGRTALMFAAQNGHTETVKTLIENGANVNSTDKRGLTALMLATKNSHTEIIELLLSNGSDKELKDTRGHLASDFSPKTPYKIRELLSSPAVKRKYAEAITTEIEQVDEPQIKKPMR